VFTIVNNQPDPKMGLVRDGPIFYLVLNHEDNTFTNEVLDRLNKFLDEVENSEGPACLVSIGTGSRFYSTGFNVQYWAKSLED